MTSPPPAPLQPSKHSSPLAINLDPFELIFFTPPTLPHPFFDSLEDLPPRTTNPPPPRPSFDTIECLANQPMPLPAMEPPLPPLPPQLLPLGPNNPFPMLTHEMFCDHCQYTQVIVNNRCEEMSSSQLHISFVGNLDVDLSDVASLIGYVCLDLENSAFVCIDVDMYGYSSVGRFDVFFRNQLLVFQQHQDESLYDSWTRFKDIIRKVPNHGLSIWTLIEIFLKHLDSLSCHIINLTAEGDLRKFSDIGAWYAIEDCAQYDKKCSNPTSAISDETIANLNAQIVGDDMVRVQVPRCMAWLNYDEHTNSLSTMDNKVGVTSP
ncbi:hypothetical protein Tco_0888133 [Tanacetum coccineum]